MDLAFIARRLDAYERLIRLDKPIGTLLLLWPTLWALWLASNGAPRLDILIVFVVGTLLMRSAGCAINDYADRNFDGHVERTRERPLATGEIAPREALVVAAALAAAAFALVLFLNWMAIALSFVALAIAASYPFTKRFFALPQAYLGVAFGFGIPMAYAAVQFRLPAECWTLFAANLFFAFAYDTEYAMVDRDEDLRVGAKSTAILFGDADRVIIGVLMATFLFAMLLAGTRVHLDWPYFVGLAGAAGLFGWQQWLIRDRARDACFAAFRNNNLVGLLIWLGLLFALAIR